MTALSRRLALLSAVVASVASAQFVQPPYATNAAGRAERPCANDVYALEVPTWAAPFPAGFEAGFSKLPLDGAWFGCPTCTLFRGVLTPVLTNRSAQPVVALRADGDRRSFLVRLETYERKVWRPVVPQPQYACEVVKALRKKAFEAASLALPTGASPQPRILVSRSCDVVAQDVEATVPTSTTGWASARMQANPQPSAPRTKVALIDTGVRALDQAGLGVVSETALPPFAATNSASYHPHATHMAALIREVAPNAELRSYRALDERGMGSTASLARALDTALYDNGPAIAARSSMVLNLSVGLPSEFLRPASLRGNACQTWEDGVGETLRYVLLVASRLEQQGKAVVVVAASGNHPLENATTSQTPWALPPAVTPCGTYAATDTVTSFAPATFGLLGACEGGVNWALPVLPIGASTFDDQRSVLNVKDSYALLFAPGERVFASNASLPQPPSAIDCGASGAALEHGFELPTTVTGTSASAALVTAAAAHLMAMKQTGPLGGGWTAADVGRLLYLTGSAMCPKTVPATLDHRLALGRAVTALLSNAPACDALRHCLRSQLHPAGTILSSSTAAVCETEVATCVGLETCAGPRAEPGWPAAYVSAIRPGETCSLAWQAPTRPAPRHVEPDDAPFPSLQLAGLGPQPAGSGCPNCSLLVTDAAMVARYELNDAFPVGTRLFDPFVGFVTRNKTLKAFSPLSDGRDWTPGEVGELHLTEFVGLSEFEIRAAVLEGKLTPVFDVGVAYPESRAARVSDPMRVE